MTTTAEITKIYTGRNDPDVRVHFADPGGKAIEADIDDTSATTHVRIGGQMQIRYDPEDPVDRVEDANADMSTYSLWLYGIGGVMLLIFAAYGASRLGGRP